MKILAPIVVMSVMVMFTMISAYVAVFGKRNTNFFFDYIVLTIYVVALLVIRGAI